MTYMTYMTGKNMRTVRYIRITVAMMMLLTFGAGSVWAENIDASKIIIEIQPAVAEAANCNVQVASTNGVIANLDPQDNTKTISYTVTLTVTPASGYYIKASDIMVEPLAGMGRANAQRRGGVMDLSNEIEGTLYNDATAREDANVIYSVTGTSTAYYVFELPERYDGAYVTATFTETVAGEIRIPNGSSITYNANGHYILENDIDATELEALFTGSETTAFSGIFEGIAKADGTFPKITGQTHALFSTIDGGTVKNVMLDNVGISGSTTINSKKATGAIANVAKGATRIYNCGILATNSTVTTNKDGYTEITECSSTVGNSESDYVGGLVGFLDGEARVINCFSYAKITAGNTVGGIVGYNNVATTANSSNPSTYLKTMVMNCMFYGEIDYDNTTSRAPVYNGEVISNKDANGISNFNYFWAGASYVQNSKITSGKYNCALSAETRYLQRFEFFRHLLNSNRELAAWWASTTTTTVNKDEMMKWVLEPSQIGSSIPYPILKAPLDSRNKAMQYPSVVNIDADNAEAFSGDEATKKTQYNQGRKFGTLTINIQNSTGDGSSNAPAGAAIVRTTVTANITDKDPAHFNFNYYKVQLPYYNDVGTKNYTDNKVVTGWKIVSMNTSKGSFSTGSEASAEVDDNGNIILTTPYNYADRKSTVKDIYSATNKRVFNQGAYFDVPEGVTSITIEPYWGKCVYVSDEYPDIVYNQAMSTAYNASNVGGSSRYTDDELYPINGDNQKVYTTMGNAVAALQPSGTVYDNAIVLVGNVHSLSLSSVENNKPYTIMSIDLDKDNEPDYSYILRFNSRVRVHPIRVDFLNVIGLGMAQKSSGGTGTYNFGIMQPLGWFEVTNTGLFRVTQLEYDRKGRTNSPIILQGGVIEQWVTYAQGDNEANAVQYYHVGGNVWFKEFHIGQHQDRIEDNAYSPHPPISVTGGDYDIFYLTGYYNTPKNNYDDNAECYINGGRFGKVAGTGMQGIGSATNHTNGNIVWQIDNADIDEFYAGGINAAHIAEGNIYTVISNSRVDQFCGGPKFGDMNSNKKVVTNATNCTFRTFFGAGYGGNSYNRRYPANQNEVINIDWNDWVQGNDGLKYRYNEDYGGVETRIDYQFIPMSNNTQNVARLFVDYVSFSLATTYDVTSKLTGCTITTAPLGRLTISDDYNCLGNFYGGGSLGKVAGPVKSTLINCTVEGNAFGAGYSATLPTVAVMNDSFQTEPKYDSNLGAYLEAELPSTVTYKWEHRDQVNSNETAIDKTNNHILYTTEDLTTLGQVTGKVTLNIEGNTLVKGNVTENNVTTQSGGVYGGGDASAALGDTEVNIDASGQQSGFTYNAYNVFGGGNKADVGGSVVVNMKNGVVDNDVFGGGALANTNIGNVTAGYGTDSETIPNTTTKTTTVNLQGGTIYGDAYGGGLGRKAATGIESVEATVYGDITVNLGDADASVAATAFNISNYTGDHAGVIKSGRVFGANNLNGSPKGDVTVNIYKTVTGNQSRTDVAAYKKKENETGYAAPTYEVAAVYGGGNLADYTTTGKTAEVNIWTCDASVESVYGGGNAAAVPSTQVTVYGAYEIHYVFGGGNGKDPYTLDGGSSWTPNHGADVTSNASTVLTGGFIHEAYGASNEKGTIGGAAALHADDAGDSECALDVWKLVGAGKNADFFGDVNLVLGCMPEAKVDAIYGGADNANVFGNVTLTVTSGNFGAVYGGNNLGGIINGQIILNIEETGCRPINIDKLYLGGNQAAYSKYGYYVKTTETESDPATGDGSLDEEAILTNGKLTLLPRTSADDVHKPVKSINGTEWILYDEDHYPEFTDPILNVRSFTSIGEIFGGGYGTGAVMYANPTVNINQTYGKDYEGMEYTAKATGLGTIGDVYGGGDAAAVQGITTVNIGTETTVDFITEPSYLGTKGESLETAGVAYIENTDGTFETKVQGAIITGNVYGGGKLANVKDITNVNIGAKDNGSGYVAVTEGAAGVTIAGNVYGGGKGEAAETGERAFFCEEAMVGEDNLNSESNNISSEYANHGTHIRIGHGKVNGSVYGGGEMGRVEFHTEVTIGYGDGTGSDTKSPVIDGYVYGAGKGSVTHGYSGLVRGNSKVTIQGDAKVGQSVYGGGEKASVGKYLVVDGLPKKPLWGGVCTVTIQGYAEIGPDNMHMVTASGKPDDTGHVFGAGAGVLPYENVTGIPYSIQPSGKVEYDGNEVAYLTFIKTLGLASNTYVTIGGHAFVKGSVYGGSENGYVQENTHVTIAGGQVGNGDGVNKPYTDKEWVDEDPNTLKECAHWPYQAPYAPYDIYKDSNNDGKPDAATDGHTFFGNVFGGGRGYYPYAEGPELTERQRQLGYSKGIWLREAGSVGGNTVVDITGGHILTSVYGGNEMTDVTGSCTINMVGGTVGVPRTVAQMQAHPVTCYVFGAGKGDQRVNFNQQTNVASTQVNISGTARIYGSTFGGGEDGHVIGDVETNIGGDVTIGSTTYNYSDVIIGTTGTSSVDGNIFGGGRGFSETALTAGVVCGDVSVKIHNGKILGSVFGGGRLASVGTYLTTPMLEDGSTQNPNYGKMQEDSETVSHGHTNITIDGGTIGATDNQGKLVTSDYTIGDVFGGGKGSSHSSSEGHLRYGEVKTTSIIMNGGRVNGSVYGGGEIATVEGNTTIAINGGEVGDGVTKKGGAKIGNVYGGGKGSLVDPDDGLIKGNTRITISETDKTDHPTIIYHNIYGGGAYGSVGDIHRSKNDGVDYVPGRDEKVLNMPTDWGNTGTDNGTAEIIILGGQIGTDGDENGMVFGSSRGDVEIPTGADADNPFGTDVDRNDRTAWVFNTKVEIGTSGSDAGPEIRGSVYGSGENGHVFDDTEVKIHSGKIGVDANTTTYGSQSITDPVTNIEYTGADYPKRGNVYGGGCGEDSYTISDVKYYNPLAGIVLGNSKVTIDGGQIVHNVYGAGALGSVVKKATIEISGGQVGVEGSTGGNVFGAARGNLDIIQAHIAQVKETKVDIKPNDYNDKPDPVIWNDVFGGGEAGIVTGSVAVTVSGGEVKNDVYGGGALANTNTDNVTEGYGTDSETIPSTSTYTTTVNLTGGLIGNAYGGGLGRQARSAVEAQEAVCFTQQECNEFNATLEGAVTTSDVNPLTSQNYTQEEADAYNATLEGAISVSDIKIPAIEAQDEETEVAALVYGDVEMIIDGTKFHQQPYSEKQVVYYTDKDENDQDKTFTSKITQYGRVFGANNIKGTPKGNILVTVNKTVPEDGGEHEYGHYEIHSVYGGGNLADYLPIDGKNTQVVVDNCGEISIEYVYGGGNSASVPQTLVTVNGCFEIGMIFGGGNGEDPVQNTSGVWVANPGADVKKSDGTAGTGTINAYGGTIRWLYGGSNKKGLCGVISQNLNSTNPECPLKITNVYGAGRNADVQEVFVVAKCPGENIEYIYGGSYNANINNGITLTLIGGQYKNVYGGNDSGGTIGGPINVNIQESYDCSPIIIDNLYGGGNKAEYPGNNGTGGSITVNVKSCTYIGNIFGAGRGDGAVVNGNVTVNLNMTKGILAGSAQTYTLNWDKMDITKSDEQIIRAIETEIPNILVTSVDKTNKTVECRIKNEIGTIGNVYGGGDEATVNGTTQVNIGTAQTVAIMQHDNNGVPVDNNNQVVFDEDGNLLPGKTYNDIYYLDSDVLGVYINGNVFGGGNLANVTGNTYVNIGAKKVNDTEVWESVPVGSEGLTIAGNVYGGGKGAADNFECDKAMVGINGAGADDVNYPDYTDGNTNVIIGNGTINGTVYGGGEIGRVEMNTTVLIGFGNGTTDASKPEIKGNVFGGGKGVETHGYSALVRGNPTVIIEGKAKVRGSVYGGGEIASVARYKVKTDANDPDAPTGWPMNMPYALKDANSGLCTVTIGGYAEIGPEAPMHMITTSGNPDDLGHVFGAGKGFLPTEYTYADNDHKPKRMVLNENKTASIWEYFSSEAAYIGFIQTLALASETEVTIKDHAFVKGSVYGGSENGIVQYNTHVTIDDDCQIGAGNDVNRRYTPEEWLYDGSSVGQSLAECASWEYKAPYVPYDIYDLDGNNKPKPATDGHTFYGNVFGGGSGYYPYRRKSAALDGVAWIKDDAKSTELGMPVDKDGYSDGVWLSSAGIVRGNTVVDIKGGHILTSVYGGNEQTDVQGSCTINMSGGTLGVPRTLDQIDKHPVTCYLFGAGKGDMRINFNNWTNVASVNVNITGGRIFGSVFGGGEDGHVLGNVEMEISGNDTKIGTTGTSYVDGNVFGGGRGFSGDAQTAGTVGGNVTVNIIGGEMLGSIYGGGRLASVGTQFTDPYHPDYGNFVEDNAVVYYSQEECYEHNSSIPGYIPANTTLTEAQAEAYNAETTGANKSEGDQLEENEANAYNSKLPGYITTESVKTPARSHGHVILNISGGTIGNKNATGERAKYSGNVFGGSMGRLELLNGTRNPIWPKMAQVKSTAVNISGNAEIIRNVYGGGELGTVRDNAYVTIGGTRNNDGTITKSGSPTIYRDVYGGGYGSDDKSYTIITVKEPNTANPTQLSDYITNRYAFSPMQFAGCVGKSTTVNICGGYIWKSVYGGGEMASVGIFNSLVQDVTTKPGDDKVIVEQEGNTKWTIYSNIIKHYDDESTFALSWPYKFEYLDVFPGTTQINITGGRIGAKEGSDANSLIANNEDFGDVYGGGKGIAGDYNDYIFCANVGSTEITIDYTDDENKVTDPSSDATSTGNYITGAVYGGAENGHVMGDTKIILNNGLIGHALYGGGSGKGQYPKELVRLDGKGNVTHDIYSITAGKVFGNTEIQMTGGYVVRNVYGGGTYGSVGKGNYAGGTDDYSYYYNNADQTQYNGYGEALKGPLWTSSEVGDDAWQFLNSGICKVTITGGTIGYIKDASSAKDGLPYGNVFGGCRGASAPNITEKPRYQYTPESFMGYANQTIVTIGTKDQSSENAGQPGKAPRIYGSVYGGGQDGHVRRDATVTIYSGEIGSAYDNTKFNDDIWLHSGNVYGAGSGIGKYKYDFNYDDDYDDNGQDADHTVQYHDNNIKEEDYSTSAGSVTRYTKVEIQGGKIHRNVYGGGSLASIGAPKYPIERTDGDPESHNEVIISGGQIGSEYSYDAKDNHIYGGNVYGASRGQEGLGVRFSSSVQTNVTISGGLIKGDVYGGGEIGAVKCDVDVNLLGGTIEHSIYGGGALANTNTSNWNPATDNFADGMVTTSGKITTTYNTKLNLLGGVIGGEAYGGGLGQLENSQNNQSAVEAFVYGDVILNLNGLDKNDYSDNTIPSSLMSLMSGKVTQILNSTHEYRVSTTGAIVDQIFGANNLNGTPKGHIKVHVFATQNKNALKPTISDKFVRDEKADSKPTLFNHLADSIIIAKQLTPSAVTSAMEALNANSDADDIKTALAALKTSIDNYVSNSADATIAQNKIDSIRYDVKAVYGGGNLAAYIYGNGEKIENTDANKAKIEAARTEVIIDGCDYTSIKTVYGGGNAASASGTYVEVNSTYEINEVFGGGNGADSYYLIEGDKTVWYENPGANVGYKNYTHVVKDGSKGDGSKDNPYQAIDNTSSDAGGDASTKENRKANYGYGSGIARTEIRGGTIHTVYGGSNKKGNISTTALSVYEEADDDCQININETYGGGKDASMDGEIDLTLDCVKDMDMIFGGAKNADVNSNITLNITNGRFKRIFGGNNTSGAINGSITVNIKEEGCVPIEIVELYGGGYLAPYSIYGYEKNEDGSYHTESVSYIDDDNVVRYLDQRIPLKQGETGALTTPYNDPRINIISATHIGDVYGGGYQAKLVGSPHVNVNMTNGKVEVKKKNDEYVDGDGTVYDVNFDDEDKKNYATLDIGTIDNIYGGGNLADIVGNTYVEIGTGKWITWDDQHNPIWETVDASDKKYTSSQTNDAVNYTQAECNTHNEALTGYIASGVTLTSEKAAAVNTALSTTYIADDVINTEDAAAYNRTLTDFWTTASVKTEAVLYTAEDEEVIAGTKQVGDVKTPAVYYTQAECNTHNATLAGYITCTTTLTAKQAVAVNEAIESNYAAGAIIYTEDAAAFNATLNGHITTADVKTPAVWTWYDADNEELNTTLTPARNAANITGDVYGGGKGLADNFTCNKAMVGMDGDGINNPDGGTYVTIVNGTIGGSVYGGGMIARVEKNTTVTIGLEEATDATLFRPTSAPVINGNVFGAGKGVETHGYSALVRGNPTVIIQGNTKVGGSVYGGGEIASVARYKVVNGTPVALANKTSGNCKVIVRGNAEIGPDNMKMNNTTTGKPDNTGHVFGAGKGILPKIYSYVDNDKPRRMLAKGTPLSSTYSTSVDYDENNIWEYFGNDEDYHKFIETLALSSKTDVTISDNAFVKGSVYGGSQNGIVQYNTHVTIEGDCQIGAGFNETTGKSLPKYNANQFIDPTTTVVTSDNALAECAHWDYGMDTDNDGKDDLFASYDPFAEENGEYDYTKSNYSSIPSEKRRSSTAGGMREASDGHTYYGNVFGGGSGVEPYAPGLWHRAAGIVRGNTVVDITGGHILTSVYGGNEHTDVGTYTPDDNNELTVPKSGGLCTINFGGTATLGVPRTLEQIAAHPVTCYLFGAGKGDTRIFFNTWTNIREAEVNITGGKIYGSVFGGGEDGHVMENITVNINEDDYNKNSTNTRTLIGTTGTSYVDGNVFGAGRGFSGDALTAGSVGGNVEVNISGGTMLGSVYGGGRLASVGIGFNAATDANYGSFTPDTDNNTHGHVTVNISGGTIGNDLEDITVEHPKGGNVFGGSMGRLTLLDGSYNKLWPQLAQVKTATVNISGNNTIIKGSVYGGSELGTVRDSTNIVVGKASLTSETITRPTIYRNIFGGGYGSIIRSDESKATIESKDANNNTILFGYTPMQWSGLVGINTRVNIYNGWIKKCIYGGGEMASVGIINYILDDTQYNTENDVPAGKLIFRIDPETNKYVVYKNIVKHVDEEKSFALSWPYQLDYIQDYKGNSYVNIYGGRIGITGKDFMGPFNADGNPLDSNGNVLSEDKDNKADAKKIKDARLDNGDVFGGGKGFAGDRYEYAFCANVQNTHVTINYDTIRYDNNSSATPETYKNTSEGNKISNYTYANDCVSGAVYGGGENGHVMGNTEVNLINGLVGHAIYGGGNGKGQFTKTLYLIGSTTQTHPVDIYSITAGKVYGNTKVNMEGGYVVRNIYGGGNMGSVGKGTYAGGTDDYSYYDFLPIRLFNGYGEAIDDLLWTPSENFDPTLPIGSDNQPITMADYFLSSGKTEVTITGGQIGFVDEKPDDSMKDGLPYGNVFGGCRGESAPNIQEIPRYDYSPECYSGYVNETKVTIGNGQGNGPIIYGSVYGGGQDGHVRRDTKVTINNATIGLPYNTDNRQLLGTLTLSGENEPTEQDNALISSHNDVNDAQWLFRGNVFGAGSGIGQYKYDFNANNRNTVDTDHDEVEDDNETEIEEWNYHNPITGEETLMKEVDYSTSAGSVTRFTNVEINGGTIYRNVYGGGSQASVGPPKIPIRTDDDPYRKGDTQSGHGVGKQTLNEVIINGGTIGSTNSRTTDYGGNVYGASRGNAELLGLGFSTSVWTTVEANNGYIYGNVFGGGESGSVTMDTKVIIGGEVPQSTSNGAQIRTVAPQPAVQSQQTEQQAQPAAPSGQQNVATEAPVNRSVTRNRADQ